MELFKNELFVFMIEESKMNTALENMYAGRELQSVLFYSVCAKYGLTLAELLVLLYLAGNKSAGTATDIVDKLKLTKSHVSMSVRALKKRGYLKGTYEKGDRRTIRLSLCEAAALPVAEAKDAESRFIAIMENGFSEKDREVFQDYLSRATYNMNAFLSSAGD